MLPMYFEGRNSALFHAAGLIHPWMRSALLPREMLNKQDRCIRVRIARPIPYEKLEGLSQEEIIAHVRFRTYLLQNRKDDDHRVRRLPASKRGPILEPIVAPRPTSILTAEVRALTPGHVLVDTGRFTVFSALAHQIPNILHEIGRLREITFREAGEGTRKSIDRDRFDEYYTHLFLWNKEREELVGAYRLGLTDRILPEQGAEGLYTRTLFEYGVEFLDRIHPAVEVGRSFVRREYQKDYHPLMLLWKGIGHFLVERPRYRNLFGPVSINNDYHSISRQLIVAFSRNTGTTGLARMVRGKNPPRIPHRRGEARNVVSILAPNLDDLSHLIEDIEGNQKGIPILLKHYMKLGGELLGSSVDHHFSDALDVLILVDLARTNPRVLERYMGKTGSRSFLMHHGAAPMHDEAPRHSECARR